MGTQRGNRKFSNFHFSKSGMTDMYRLPPIIPATMEFQLPDRMYKLPLIQKSNVTTISNPSVEVTKCERNDDQVLKELERRQEAILEKLASLKLQVSTLKGDKHVAITQLAKMLNWSLLLLLLL